MKLKFLAAALSLLFTVVSLVSLAGCQEAAPAVTPPSTSPAAPVTYTDDIGRNVQVKSFPRRIISLSPSNTEMIYALGLEDRLIGVTTYCNYPEAVKEKPRVSEFSVVDVEKIVSLQPDLILADDIHKSDVVPALEKLGIPVLVIRPGTISRIIEDIELVGKITGNVEKAAALKTSLENRVKAITARTDKLTSAEKPGIFYITWHDPLWTAGDNTVIGELIRLAGGTNIAGEVNGYATVTLETVIERNPAIIIVMSSMGDQDTSYNYVKSEPRLQATDALKNNRVYLIDADIFGRTTPRIVDGLEQLARYTHPEIFK